ncbi:hypothetical protein B0H10DRAFT_2328479 [Mycena sp. CBHHK59/15]|nr:hypothetical protein B0H10DRAFT_2328479 [Mycena sp. CBHHK59/15]
MPRNYRLKNKAAKLRALRIAVAEHLRTMLQGSDTDDSDTLGPGSRRQSDQMLDLLVFDELEPEKVLGDYIEVQPAKLRPLRFWGIRLRLPDEFKRMKPLQTLALLPEDPSLTRALDFLSLSGADEILGEEYLTVQEYIKEKAAAKAAARPDTVELVPVHIPDEPSKPFSQGLYTSVDVVDFSPLIQQRLQHQTKFAENCTRTKTTRPAPLNKR